MSLKFDPKRLKALTERARSIVDFADSDMLNLGISKESMKNIVENAGPNRITTRMRGVLDRIDDILAQKNPSKVQKDLNAMYSEAQANIIVETQTSPTHREALKTKEGDTLDEYITYILDLSIKE